MNVFQLIPSTGLPPARQALVVLNNRIADAEKRLRTLQSGKAALADELGRAAGAKAELQDLVAYDAVRLVDRLRDGGQWLLSSFGNARARELSASLSESRIQAAVGETALVAVGEEIAGLERSISDMKASKQDAILAVMKEASAGYVADLANVADDLRQTMTILSGLDRITATSTGEWSPNQRVVVTLPSVGGVPETVVISPTSEIEKARSIWAAYAQELEHDALAKVGDHLKFPSVDPHADAGLVPYETLHPAERRIVDLENAGTRLGAN